MNLTEIQAGAKAHLSPDAAERYLSHVRESAGFSHAAGAESGSRLGGHPTVDIESWPTHEGRPLSFLACIDLADLEGIRTNLDLPSDGTLSFFYDTDDAHQPWGHEPGDKTGWSVVYTEAGGGTLTPAPADAEVFNEIPLTARQTATCPMLAEPVVQSIYESERDALFRFADQVIDPAWDIEGNHQLGGWPLLQQGHIWNDAHFGLAGVAYHDRRNASDPTVSEREDALGDWVLLFQLDSDNDAGWMWGDGGTLFFSIRRQDLAERRFDRCWMSLQCG